MRRPHSLIVGLIAGYVMGGCAASTSAQALQPATTCEEQLRIMAVVAETVSTARSHEEYNTAKGVVILHKRIERLEREVLELKQSPRLEPERKSE